MGAQTTWTVCWRGWWGLFYKANKWEQRSTGAEDGTALLRFKAWPPQTHHRLPLSQQSLNEEEELASVGVEAAEPLLQQGTRRDAGAVVCKGRKI